MKSAANILTLFVILLASVACQTTIPNVRVHKEIPFLDAPEAVYVETVSWNEGIVNAEDWARLRPKMLMITPEGWKAIKDSWYEACRKAGSKCTSEVESIDKIIQSLDKVTESILKPGSK